MNIVFVTDPENEIGFSELCKYCETIQEQIGNEAYIVPMWPHGKAQLISDDAEALVNVIALQEILDNIRNRIEASLKNTAQDTEENN